MAVFTKAYARFKQWHLIVLGCLWLLLHYYNQKYLPNKHAKQCEWSIWNKDLSRKRHHNFLLVADPQLVDNHTYPSYNSFLLGVTKHTSDVYLKKNFEALSKNLRPASIIFLGDYLDNGRSSMDDYYKKEIKRFHSIFKDYNNIGPANFITNLPGNHDIGWKNGIKEKTIERFEESFGAVAPYEIFNTLFVPVDGLGLSNTENQKISSKPRKLLNELSISPKTKPRILLTHVPLMRSKTASCGPLRESQSFPFVAGYQFQTVLDDEISKEILTKSKPDLIFSGDDHDYCFVTHKYKQDNDEISVNEITVKSISMTMGISRPAVELLTIIDENDLNEKDFDKSKISFNTEICYLPTPYNDIISCVILSVISGLVIIANTYVTVSKQKRYAGYTKTKSRPNLISKLFQKYQPQKESPYAAMSVVSPRGSSMESFNIEVEDGYEDYTASVNNHRKRRTRGNTLFFSPKNSFKVMLARMILIVCGEFAFMGLVAILLYFYFVF